jgi:hypothetical protein
LGQKFVAQVVLQSAKAAAKGIQALSQDGVCFDFLRRLDGEEIGKQTAICAQQVLDFF